MWSACAIIVSTLLQGPIYFVWEETDDGQGGRSRGEAEYNLKID